jgi:hypothetical protein
VVSDVIISPASDPCNKATSYSRPQRLASHNFSVEAENANREVSL